MVEAECVCFLFLVAKMVSGERKEIQRCPWRWSVDRAVVRHKPTQTLLMDKASNLTRHDKDRNLDFACHEIATSQSTKCCTCHEICTSTYTKCMFQGPPRRVSCQTICSLTAKCCSLRDVHVKVRCVKPCLQACLLFWGRQAPHSREDGRSSPAERGSPNCKEERT